MTVALFPRPPPTWPRPDNQCQCFNTTPATQRAKQGQEMSKKNNGELERVIIAGLNAYREDRRHDVQVGLEALGQMVNLAQPMVEGVTLLMRAEAEKDLAQAEAKRAEGSKTQAEALKIKAEAEKTQAEASLARLQERKMKAEVALLEAQADKAQAEANLAHLQADNIQQTQQELPELPSNHPALTRQVS